MKITDSAASQRKVASDLRKFPAKDEATDATTSRWNGSVWQAVQVSARCVHAWRRIQEENGDRQID